MKVAEVVWGQFRIVVPARKPSMLAGIVIAVMLASSAGYGQSVNLSGIAHTAFRVSDVQRTSLFYQSLGFDQAFAFSKDGKFTQSFIKINDRQFIELYPQTLSDPLIGFMHLCFEGADLNELDAGYRARGLNPTEVKKAHAGNLLFTMVGPEQQNIEYTEYMPGSLHSSDRSKHLGKHRISEHLLAVDLAMRDPGAERAFYVEKLSFQPAGGESHALLLPGSSGEAVEFHAAGDRAAPDIVFEVRNLERTAKALRKKGLAVRVEPGGIFITDPDGIPIEFARTRAVRP